MSDSQNIVILGGGYAGVEAARKLAKTFRKRNEISITLIDRNPWHTLMTELHEVAGYRVDEDSVRVSFAKIFGASKVRVLIDTIESVDFKGQKVMLSGGEVAYDWLLVGLGAEPVFFGLPGVHENSFTLWSYDDAIKIRHHIETVFEKAISESNVEKRKRMLNFVVAGAGFTGIEMAGELLEWRDAMCQKWLVDKNEVSIKVVEAMPHILPIFEADLAAKIDTYLKKKNVEVMVSTPIVGAEPGAVLLKDGSRIETDTFIWTCGVQGASSADALALEKGPRPGRLQATEEMRSVGYSNVFIAGDNIWFEEGQKPLPQIVETALQTAEVAAHNIAASIDNKPLKVFRSNYHGFMVSVGGKYAVSNAGGMKLSGFFAMAMKHLINLHYLFGLAGFNQCWEYLKHEFLDMRSQRNLVWGFGSYKTRGYWLLPLRLWLGLMWIMEGVNKIGEGWLSWSHGSKSGWMFSKGVYQAGVTPIVDSVSAASEEWGETTVSWATDGFGKFWDMNKTIFNIDGPVATWFRTVFMDSLAAYIPFNLFQLAIVLVEIAIGLALFGGLFTWPAAAVSIVMCIVFTLSGMFSWGQLWFVFAAFLFLGGGGRAFGLDSFVMPVLKKWWNGTRFARKRHWYLDGPSRK
jgi:NADH:ubiquinone reductase (H+-translocating)